MNILKKRIVQLVLISSILCLIVLPSYAKSLYRNEGIIIQPYWTEISQFNNSFNITASGRTDIESSLSAFNVDTISVEAHLQQFIGGSWVIIKTWTGTSQDIICQVAGSWYVQKGYSYRLVSTGTVFEDGKQVEHANYMSEAKWY